MNTKQQHQAPFSAKVLIGYLYFLQGLFIAICGTVPLTYKVLPGYAVLAYFSATTLPFSFKFITAPLVQKYSNIKYGRRKFWIVISLSVSILVLYMVSNIIEDEQNQIYTAFLLGMVMLCLSIQDISTDGLGIKQLKNPQLSSLLQSVYQQIGIVLGSLSFGQLTSKKFANYLGFQEAIVTPSQYILFIIPLVLVVVLWIHFYFKESSNLKQSNIANLSLWQVVTHYKHFILPKYHSFRQALLFVTMFQGTTIFQAGYSIQLINNSILSKQFIISLGNISLIVIFPATYILSKKVTSSNLQTYEKVFFYMRCLFIAFVFFVDSKDSTFASIAIFVLQLIGSMHFYLQGIIMNSFQHSKFQGMSVTMMGSLSNLGRNSTIHLNLIGMFGFSTSVMYSFVYSGIYGILLSNFHKWINNGKQQQPQQITQHPHSD